MSWISNIFESGDNKGNSKNSAEKAVSARVLKNLMRRHAPLIINFNGSPDQYLSMILGVDEANSIIQLDEFTPPDGHKKATSGAIFRASGNDGGIAVSFKSHVLEHNLENGLAVYTIAFPEKVEYLQRREGFRIKISHDMANAVTLHLTDKITVESEIIDISFTGVRLALPGQSPAPIQPGQRFSSVKIRLLDEFPIEAIGEVRFVAYQEVKDKTLLGIHFVEMERDTQRIMNQAVIAIQREIRKRDNRSE